ncbi:MAG: NAD(P)-dependent oxidoreductase [Bacilli bacterium]|nr:NAD(P)-dependent oxidoreductase [Bacilli bacterium]
MKIAFIGLGTMGLPMANNLAKEHEVTGFDVFPKETSFPFAHSYQEAIQGKDVIFSMVPKNEDVLALYEELAKYAKPGQIFVDMSTIMGSVSSSVAAKMEAIGCEMLDAPVVKSQPAAVKGELGIYVGGKREIYEKVLPLLRLMGSNIIYMGDHGTGCQMKILHNALVGEIQNGVNEILGLAEALGLDLNQVVEAFGYGGAKCFYLDTKAQNIIKKEFPTAFSVENMDKDVHFANSLAKEAGKECPALQIVAKVYEKAMGKGYGKEDFSASYKAVNKE